jgi:hypothetical protein
LRDVRKYYSKFDVAVLARSLLDATGAPIGVPQKVVPEKNSSDPVLRTAHNTAKLRP